MKRRSDKSGKKCGKPKKPAPGTKRNSSVYALLALSFPLLLSACAGNPPRVECRYPMPNPDLMAPPPPEGYFRQNLDQTLALPSTERPTGATN